MNSSTDATGLRPEEIPTATSVRPAPALELNERNIKAALPGAVLRDANIKGLHLRCFATKKVFYLYFRTRTGVERKPKLGDYGSVTLAQARDAAQQLLAQVMLGNDPSAERSAARGEITLNDLWEIYQVRHLAGNKTAKQDVQRYVKQIKPKLGGRRLSEIRYEDVAALHAAKGRAAPISANRTLALLRTMFAFASDKLHWNGRNPCKGVDKFPESKRRRYLSVDEARRLGAALDEAMTRAPHAAVFLYLLIYTGARKGEIRAARWDWLDGQALRLPDSKTGARTVYLPQAAMDVLAKLPRTNGTICGINTPQRLWDTVRVVAKLEDMKMHDLRHSFASSALGAGYSLAQIGELLGHSTPVTTQRYAHLMEEAAHAAASKTGELIAARMGAQA